MGKIKSDGKAVDVKDGEPIIEACEELGVPIGCGVGVCGVCEIQVQEGADNLSDITEEEQNLGMTKTRRLACQCKLKKGDVKIKF
jgi:ferredoxin